MLALYGNKKGHLKVTSTTKYYTKTEFQARTKLSVDTKLSILS